MTLHTRSAALPIIAAATLFLGTTACSTEADTSSFLVEIYPSKPEAQVDDLMCVVTNLPEEVNLASLQVTWMVNGENYDATSRAAWSGPYTTLITDDTVPAVDVYPGQDWLCYVESDGVLTVGVVDIPTLEDLSEDVSVDPNASSGSDQSDAQINIPEVAGTWTLDTPIAYSCAIEDWFQFSMEDMQIDQDGQWVWIDSGSDNPGTLSGTVNAHSNIYAERYVEGACTERYQLDVRLTDSGTMEGSFTATFYGSGCYDCSLQSWDITATRR